MVGLKSHARVWAGRALRMVDGPVRRYYSGLNTQRPYVLNIVPAVRPFSGQTAVVTGASGALGRAIALRLGAQGAEVWALGRDDAKLDALINEIDELGGVGHSVVVDVTNDAAVAEFFDSFASIDILVTSAGGGPRLAARPVYDQTMDVIDTVLDTNLRATILTVSHASKKMLACGGRIVCLSSVIGQQGHRAYSEYAAAKAGIVGFVRSAAIDLGPHGVRINALSPGKVPRGVLREREQAKVERTNVLAGICTHEDVAEGVAYLVGSGGAFITGHDLVIDGGRSLGLRGDN